MTSPIQISDQKITQAIEQLNKSERGQAVARQLQILFSGPASMMDYRNTKAVLTLCGEFFLNGRREFVSEMTQ